jgi:hypothetical protein
LDRSNLIYLDLWPQMGNIPVNFPLCRRFKIGHDAAVQNLAFPLKNMISTGEVSKIGSSKLITS